MNRTALVRAFGGITESESVRLGGGTVTFNESEQSRMAALLKALGDKR